MYKKIIAVSTAVLLAFGAAGCSKKDDKQKKETTNATNVTVYTVNSGDIDSTASYTGEIIASENTAVSAKVSGDAQTVYVKEGDFVRAGSKLVTIDPTSYRLAYNQALAAYNSAVSSKKSAEASKKSAEAGYNSVTNGSTRQTLTQLESQLNAAQIAYDNALDIYNKQKTLYDLGAISETEFNTYKTSLENAELSLNTAKTNYDLTKNVVSQESAATAKASVESAEASVNSAQSGIESAKAALDIAKNNLDNCTVTAPISGYISSKSVNKGQMVAQGTPVVTITNTSLVDAEISVTESVIPLVDVGTKANVNIKSANVENVEGVVTLVNPVKDEKTGLYTVKVSMSNADGKLKQGMIADITLVTESDSNAITIPVESLMQDDSDGYYVYVAKGKKAQKRNVETGIMNDESAQILSGIEPGDRVIVSGKEYISDKNNEIKIVEK